MFYLLETKIGLRSSQSDTSYAEHWWQCTVPATSGVRAVIVH